MATPNDWNTSIIDEFHANGGKVGGRFANATILLLHTIGAKSKTVRVNPVACLKDGDRLVVIASKGGAPTHPAWYHNILANPDFEVEVGTEQFKVHASVAEEPERTRLYEKMVAILPSFGEYRQKTTRVIPVIILTRAK